jgi:protein ImuB
LRGEDSTELHISLGRISIRLAMAFAAIYIPNFPVQAVVRAEPALRGAAIALVEGAPPVAKVAALNERARQAGVERGMARALAEQFEAVRIRFRSRAQEKAAHAALLDIGWSVSPRVEDTAPDTIVLDLAGLFSLFGSDEKIAHQLTQRVTALGLAAHVAIASNIETAIHAARGFPGMTLIPSGEESKHLGSLPVSVLGPSAEILETLERWGVRTCEALAGLPVLPLSERLGQEGVRLQEWARGSAARSMNVAEPATCFEEELGLEDSVEELEPLSFLLGRLLGQLCMRLAARSLAVCTIGLRFELDPSCIKEARSRKDDSGKRKSHVYEKTLTLPVPMLDSKMLLNLIRLHLQGDPPKAPILKIFMAAEPAKPRAVQTGLFLPAFPDAQKLELTIARLANLVGNMNVGSPQLLNTHRPGEFRMDKFVPVREEPKSTRGKRETASAKTRRAVSKENAGENAGPAKTAIGFRMFRPPLAANVQFQRNRPRNVQVRGTRGEVIAASGPWRTSGNWWREDNWHQDEWDLEVRFQNASKQEKPPASRPQNGLYRFYFDWVCQSWFVRGIYD